MFKKLLKTFSFFLFSLSLTVCFTKTFGQSNTNLPMISTAEEYQQLQEKLHRLTSNEEVTSKEKEKQDREKKSIAINYLKRYSHYFQVKEALLDALVTEMDRSLTDINTDLVRLIVVSISPFLSSQDSFILTQLRNRVIQHMNTTSSRSFLNFLGSMIRFIGGVISRSPEDVNAYNLSSVQNSNDHHTLLTTRLYSLFSKSTDSVKQHIQNFQNGSIHILDDHIFFKEPYHSQIYEKEANQVIETLAQNDRAPVFIGLKTHNEAVMRTVVQSFSSTSYGLEEETYFVETAPSQIKKMHENSSSDFSQAKNLRDYLDAILVIEEELQIRIVIFINKFHRLNDLQVSILRSYLQRRKPIHLVAASSREGYSNIPRGWLNFEEIRVDRMSRQDLRNAITTSILPRLQRSHLRFSMSEEAIRVVTDHVYRNYHEEPPISAARQLIVSLVKQRSQRIARTFDARRDRDIYSQPVRITDEEVHQFIQALERQQEAEAACAPTLTLIDQNG